MRLSSSLALLALPAALLGCPKPVQKTTPGEAAPYTGPVEKKVATSATREKLSVTVYNQDFGLVREIRSVDLAAGGRTALELRDVAARIQPETVHLKALLPDPGFSVLEQNFRYDLLTSQKLLQKYVGRNVKLQRWNKLLGKDEEVSAKVLAAEPGQEPVFEVGGEVTYGYGGRISFPEVPENLVAKPTLVVLLAATQPKQKIELAYATGAMGWKSDYVATISADDGKLDLTGWVTLDNRSGAAFENAELKLVAGDVQKLAPNFDDGEYVDDLAGAKEYKAKDKPSAFSEESLFEYHLYTLGRPTTLLQNEKKQVTLLEAQGVPVKKHLVFTGQSYWYRSKYGGLVASNQKVSVFLDFENKKEHNLGLPLPKGIVRVYKADKSGAQQFIGEDRIDHTPRDEKVRVKMGEAFDIVADRKQMSWSPAGSCNSESEWEIVVRNHKDVAETVELVEPAAGDWQILTSSHPSQKVDAHTFTFTVNVPKNGETKVTYKVHVRWC